MTTIFVSGMRVDSWEYRMDSKNLRKYIVNTTGSVVYVFKVYKIVLTNHQQQWFVYRRFSEFWKFDQQVDTISVNLLLFRFVICFLPTIYQQNYHQNEPSTELTRGCPRFLPVSAQEIRKMI